MKIQTQDPEKQNEIHAPVFSVYSCPAPHAHVCIFPISIKEQFLMTPFAAAPQKM